MDEPGTCPYATPHGRAPYGYRVVRSNAGTGPITLEPDPVTAPVIRHIFDTYVSGRGLQALAEMLTVEEVPRPSSYDPVRNPHHNGVGWSKGAIRAIVTNVRYTGRPTLACLGLDCRECGYQEVPPGYEALVTQETFLEAQRVRGARLGSPQAGERHFYAFRGILRCGQCQRLMQGTWNNDAPYYRCRFPRHYAQSNGIMHQPTVYLREDRLMRTLRCWLTTQVSPARLLRAARGYGPEAVRQAFKFASIWQKAASMSDADNVIWAEIYQSLALRLVYVPERHTVHVRAGLTVPYSSVPPRDVTANPGRGAHPAPRQAAGRAIVAEGAIPV